MNARIEAAHRRKELQQRAAQYEKKQKEQEKNVTHKQLINNRRAEAKGGDHPEAAEYEKYYAASGSGSAWRAREHVSLKNSPRNLRRGVYLDDTDDPKLQKKTTPKKIDSGLYERLSYRTTKQSDAEAEDLFY